MKVFLCTYVIFNINWKKKSRKEIISFLQLSKIDSCPLEYIYYKRKRKILRNETLVTKNVEFGSDFLFLTSKLIPKE